MDKLCAPLLLSYEPRYYSQKKSKLYPNTSSTKYEQIGNTNFVVFFQDFLEVCMSENQVTISNQENSKITEPFLAGHPYTVTHKNRVIQEIWTCLISV